MKSHFVETLLLNPLFVIYYLFILFNWLAQLTALFFFPFAKWLCLRQRPRAVRRGRGVKHLNKGLLFEILQIKWIPWANNVSPSEGSQMDLQSQLRRNWEKVISQSNQRIKSRKSNQSKKLKESYFSISPKLGLWIHLRSS